MKPNYNNQAQQKDFDKSIEFKLHNDFFRILNQRLDETAEIGKNVYNNRTLLQDFFRNINMLRVKYGKEFLNNNTVLKIKMLQVKKCLFSPDYSMLLNIISEKGFKRLSNKDKNYFLEIHNYCLESLEDVFETINGEMSQGELLPKVIRTKKAKAQPTYLKGVGM